jgi:hypothetical protein
MAARYRECAERASNLSTWVARLRRADWDQTLEGRPRAGYEFWRDHLRPLGFHLRAQVLEYPEGMPGDIGFFLTW